MVIFEMKELRQTDSGTYRCVATNKLGKAEKTFTMQVQASRSQGQKARFTSKFQSLVETRDGEPLHLDCSYEPKNDATLQMEWRKDGKIINNSSRMKTLSDFGFVTLDFLRVETEDTGEYTCTISNKYALISLSILKTLS